MTSCLILAAGIGARISSVIWDRPKCLLELHGKSIVRYQLEQLQACGIDNITIVTGYLEEAIRRELHDATNYLYYPDFASTNNLHTLHFARHLLDGDVIVLFSDLLTSPEIMTIAVKAYEDFALLVDTDQALVDTMRIQHRDGRLTDIGSHIPPEDGHGNFIGMAKFSAQGALLLAEELERMVSEGGHKNDYYTAALPRLAAAGQRIAVVPICGAPWIEIDDERGYEAAKQIDYYRIS